MMKAMKIAFCFVLVIVMLTTTVSATDIIDPQYGVMPIAESNEMTNSYDGIFAQATHSEAHANYYPGGWFSDAEADTELWGDPSVALADQTAYSYVLIQNSNDGTSDSDSNTTFNVDRYCGTHSILSGSNYATSVTHSARHTVYGTTYLNATETFTN